MSEQWWSEGERAKEYTLKADGKERHSLAANALILSGL